MHVAYWVAGVRIEQRAAGRPVRGNGAEVWRGRGGRKEGRASGKMAVGGVGPRVRREGLRVAVAGDFVILFERERRGRRRQLDARPRRVAAEETKRHGHGRENKERADAE